MESPRDVGGIKGFFRQPIAHGCGLSISTGQHCPRVGHGDPQVGQGGPQVGQGDPQVTEDRREPSWKPSAGGDPVLR